MLRGRFGCRCVNLLIQEFAALCSCAGGSSLQSEKDEATNALPFGCRSKNPAHSLTQSTRIEEFFLEAYILFFYFSSRARICLDLVDVSSRAISKKALLTRRIVTPIIRMNPNSIPCVNTRMVRRRYSGKQK